MASRYETLFASLKKEGDRAFIPYTMLGYPNSEVSLQAIRLMIRNGASALELGLAFSDPLADGPVIQQAAAETIETGFKTADAFKLIESIRQENKNIPITLMCYYNCALAGGLDHFCKTAAAASVDGVLVVDLPPEQSKEFQYHCARHGLAQIFIISPLTTEERMNAIAEQAGGFLYAVSRLGTTGVEERYDENLAELIKRAQQQTKLPVAVGFGVSTPEQAERMFALGADAVITGSRIIELIDACLKLNRPDEFTFESYIASMSAAGNKSIATRS